MTEDQKEFCQTWNLYILNLKKRTHFLKEMRKMVIDFIEKHKSLNRNCLVEHIIVLVSYGQLNQTDLEEIIKHIQWYKVIQILFLWLAWGIEN